MMYLATTVLFGALFGCWLRIVDAMAGKTLLTLAVFCATALTAAVAGAAAGWIGGRRGPASAAFFVALLLAAAGYHLFLMRAVGGLGAGWQHILLDVSRDYALYSRMLLKSCAVFAAAFGLLAGWAAVRTVMAVDRVRAFSWSIPGALGFLTGGWFFSAYLVSLAEMEFSLRLLPVLLGVVAAGVLFSGGDRRQRVIAVVIALAAFGTLGYTSGLKTHRVLSRGAFGRLVHRDSGFAFGDPVEEHSTLRHTLSVFNDRDYRFVFEMDNRPVIFGSRFHTARIVNGYVPLLTRPHSAGVLLVGSEAGLFAPYLLRGGAAAVNYCGADAGAVEVCMRQEARLDIRGAAHGGFETLKRGWPAGVNHDLIVLTPEPAFMRGAARFYSRRMLRRAAGALTEGGAVALHLDARALSVEAFAAVLSEMRAVFPRMQVWNSGVYEWMFVGSAQSLEVEGEAILAVLEREAVFRDLVRAGRLAVADVLACMVCDERGVDRWLEQSPGGVPLWRISLEAPRSVLGGVNALMSPALFEKVRLLSAGEWLRQGAMDDALYQALLAAVERSITARLSAVMAVAAMVSGDAEEGLRYAREAAAVNAGDAFLVQFGEALELEGRRRIMIGDYKGAVRCYENMLSLGKESPQAHYGMGHCMRAVGDMQNAYIHFARAVVGAPAQTHYRTELAEVALSIGQFETADRQYLKILELEPESAHAMLLYAKALVYAGRADRNPEKAVAMAEKACEATRWEAREAIMALADIYIEAGRLMEGMGLKRRLKEGGAVRRVTDERKNE